jgi:hypothetical protein
MGRLAQPLPAVQSMGGFGNFPSDRRGIGQIPRFGHFLGYFRKGCGLGRRIEDFPCSFYSEGHVPSQGQFSGDVAQSGIPVNVGLDAPGDGQCLLGSAVQGHFRPLSRHPENQVARKKIVPPQHGTINGQVLVVEVPEQLLASGSAEGLVPAAKEGDLHQTEYVLGELAPKTFLVAITEVFDLGEDVGYFAFGHKGHDSLRLVLLAANLAKSIQGGVHYGLDSRLFSWRGRFFEWIFCRIQLLTMQYIFFDPSSAFSPKNYPEKNQNVENYPRGALFFPWKKLFLQKKSGPTTPSWKSGPMKGVK